MNFLPEIVVSEAKCRRKGRTFHSEAPCTRATKGNACCAHGRNRDSTRGCRRGTLPSAGDLAPSRAETKVRRVSSWRAVRRATFLHDRRVLDPAAGSVKRKKDSNEARRARDPRTYAKCENARVENSRVSRSTFP